MYISRRIAKKIKSHNFDNTARQHFQGKNNNDRTGECERRGIWNTITKAHVK